MIERCFSIEGLLGEDAINCKIVATGLPQDRSIFIWVGDSRLLFDSLSLSYPPAAGPASSTILLDSSKANQTGTDDVGFQLGKRLATKFARPILLSFQAPHEGGSPENLSKHLQAIESRLLSELATAINLLNQHLL